MWDQSAGKSLVVVGGGTEGVLIFTQFNEGKIVCALECGPQLTSAVAERTTDKRT